MRSMNHIPRFGRAEQTVLFLACVIAPLAAEAYVGPGAGLSLLSALWGLLCAIGAAFLFLIMWPIRRMRRRKREATQAREHATSTEHQADSNTNHQDNNPG